MLDSTALYGAVRAEDPVTLIRSAICGVLRTAAVALAAPLRAASTLLATVLGQDLEEWTSGVFASRAHRAGSPRTGPRTAPRRT